MVVAHWKELKARIVTRRSVELPRVPLVHLARWVRDPIVVMDMIFDHLGSDRIVLSFGSRAAIISRDPDDAEAVLIAQRGAFDKQGFGYDALRELLGDGLVTSTGDFWKRQRRIVQPAFHRKRLEGFAATMAAAAEDHVAAVWRPAAATGQSVDVGATMMALTLDIVTRTLLGVDVHDEAPNVARAMDTCLRYVTVRVRSPLGPRRRLVRRFERARAELDRIVGEAIAARRASGRPHDDLLGMLMDARDDDGSGMSDRQLRDEVMTMFLAGHETTAMALTWALSLLGRHPEVQRAVRAEAREVLGDRSATFADYGALELTRRALSESMRLYPPVFMVTRRAIAPARVGPHDVPLGWQVGVSPWAIHRNPAHWPDPTRFDPDRFLPDRVRDRHKQAFLAFSTGQRKCIGDEFALVEATLVLATLLRELEVRPAGPVPSPKPSLTVRPRQPSRMVARPII